MKATVWTSLLLVILLVTLSAYLRLAHSGIGCADWPACYGQIGELPAASQVISSENAYQRIVAEASQPLAWATPLHRLVASVLGLMIVLLVILSLKQKRNRLISIALLGITVFLALLGIKSGSLHNPAIVMGNLCGGFLMLGLLGWMLFKAGNGENYRKGQKVLPGSLPAMAVLLLVIQILLGGLTSANFAATSCQTLPDCQGKWLPGPEVWKALDLTRSHEVTSLGKVTGGQERIDLHIAHRLGAVATAILVLAVGFLSWRAGGRLRNAGILVMLLVATEFVIGLIGVASGLPIGLAVSHNWIAGLLLLALLKIVALEQYQGPTENTKISMQIH
jgi:cytochrome c oxidase assembly protein subunit 15